MDAQERFEAAQRAMADVNGRLNNLQREWATARPDGFDLQAWTAHCAAEGLDVEVSAARAELQAARAAIGPARLALGGKLGLVYPEGSAMSQATGGR